MAYGSDTTIGEIYDLRRKVLKEIDIFKVGKRFAAREFLRQLLDAGSSVSDMELATRYKSATSHTDVPEDPAEFWKYIEEEYLELDAEPSEKFSELAFEIHKDLIELEKLLTYIRDELKRLETKKADNGRLTAEERYYRNQLGYYELKNLRAKNEIIDFMTYKIKSEAIVRASKPILPQFNFANIFFGSSPYAFGRRHRWTFSNPYDPRSLTIFSNKFLDLPTTTYREFVRECQSSPEKFREYANYYIEGVPDRFKSAKDKLTELVSKSHILSSRKKVIQSMLRHFEERDYLSFVSMAPLQIEGIFADICREIGISENQLDISSLNDKLDHIDGKIKNFFFFEYYSFKFPVLRNLVAHGGLIDGDLEDTAIHLLLDLLPVCELAISEDLPTINALKVLDAASKGKSEELIKWLEIRKSVAIPDFYDVHQKIATTEKLYNSPEFWEHLTSELGRSSTVEGAQSSVAVKIAGKIKSSGLAPEKADRFLKSSVQVASEAIKRRNDALESIHAIIRSKRKSGDGEEAK